MNTKKLLIGIALVSTLAACSSSKVSNDGIDQLDSETQTDTQMSDSTEVSDIDKDLSSINIADPFQELTSSEN